LAGILPIFEADRIAGGMGGKPDARQFALAAMGPALPLTTPANPSGAWRIEASESSRSAQAHFA